MSEAETNRKLRLANLRMEVIRMALSPKIGALTLRKMIAAHAEGKKEASEIGRKIAQGK